jgi:ABC-type dipeptide/oligopeptide/nickel transport system ATPase component
MPIPAFAPLESPWLCGCWVGVLVPLEELEVTTPSTVVLPTLDNRVVPESEVVELVMVEWEVVETEDVELEVDEVELVVEIGLVNAIWSLTIHTPCSALQHVALFCPQQ